MPALPSHLGRYRILRELGVGGMGSVYLAEDTKLNRQVALKVPRFDANEPQAVQRFLREAQIVARIRHEHICLVHDIDQIDGIPFLIMEYVEGTSLAQQLDQPWEPRAAVDLLRKLALAVHVLHTQDVIHRDLKPANILMRPNGEPVLLDFGLARPHGPQDLRLTATGVAVGTPAYMSPEQHRCDKDVGPRTDVYSLGVILYELLTGQLPFPGPSFIELAGQILYGKLEPPSQLRPGVDGTLDTLCMKAMARKAAERFTTAEELATALVTYLQPRSAASARTDDVPVREQVTVVCPACRTKLRASLTTVGRTRTCPRCQAPFVVTVPAEVVTLPPEKVTPKLPATINVDLGGGVSMTFVRIPAAGRTLWMGSPASEEDRSPDEDQVEVEFTRDFWMAIHKTTQAQYVAITGKDNPSYFVGKARVGKLDTRNFPVEQTSWEECDTCARDMNRRFAAELAKKLGARACVFGLPTEAQWEYACRGGATEKNSLPFHFQNGPTASLSSSQANFNGAYLVRPTTVGSYTPNRFGLYDMHGNVQEWCADYYDFLTDGRDPELATPHNNENGCVVRGGSWSNGGHDCRAARRTWYEHDFRYNVVGFRLVFRLDL